MSDQRESVPICIARRAFLERSVGALFATSVLGACASLVTRTVTPIDGALRLALVHYPELTADATVARLAFEANGSCRSAA